MPRSGPRHRAKNRARAAQPPHWMPPPPPVPRGRGPRVIRHREWRPCRAGPRPCRCRYGRRPRPGPRGRSPTRTRLATPRLGRPAASEARPGTRPTSGPHERARPGGRPLGPGLRGRPPHMGVTGIQQPSRPKMASGGRTPPAASRSLSPRNSPSGQRPRAGPRRAVTGGRQAPSRIIPLRPRAAVRRPGGGRGAGRSAAGRPSGAGRRSACSPPKVECRTQRESSMSLVVVGKTPPCGCLPRITDPGRVAWATLLWKPCGQLLPRLWTNLLTPERVAPQAHPTASRLQARKAVHTEELRWQLSHS